MVRLQRAPFGIPLAAIAEMTDEQIIMQVYDAWMEAQENKPSKLAKDAYDPAKHTDEETMKQAIMLAGLFGLSKEAALRQIEANKEAGKMVMPEIAPPQPVAEPHQATMSDKEMAKIPRFRHLQQVPAKQVIVPQFPVMNISADPAKEKKKVD